MAGWLAAACLLPVVVECRYFLYALAWERMLCGCRGRLAVVGVSTASKKKTSEPLVFSRRIPSSGRDRATMSNVAMQITRRNVSAVAPCVCVCESIHPLRSFES